MKKHTIWLMALFLIAFMPTVVSAANGNKGDWGFEPKNWRYALIEGEITSIDHDKKVLNVKGNDAQIFFCEHTEFFLGDIALPMERVFHPVEFKGDQKIVPVDLRVGDVIKSRYSKMDNGMIFLDTCLVGNNSRPGDSVAVKGSIRPSVLGP